MFGFFVRHRNAILGVALSVLALGILTTGRDDGSPLGRSLGVVGAPVQRAVSEVAHAIGSAADRYVLLVGATEEANRLRQEVESLRSRLMAVEEIYQENERLKTLLAFKQNTKLPLLPARVVGRSGSTWFRTLVLDKGSADGIAKDVPVVTGAGVVGRIYEVGNTSSRALLLSDANSAVDALVQNSRAQVVVEGAMGPDCRVLYLTREDEAKIGDKVVTSGLGGVFPKGLYLGEITFIEPVPGEIFQAAELKPGADFARLEEVFVILPDGGER